MRELVRYALLETFKYTVQYLLSRCQYHTVFITVVLWILESSSISLPVVFFTSEGFPGDARVKNLPASARDARDVGSIPGSGRSPGVANGNWLQYSCLENCMDRGAWRATVDGVAESQTHWATKQTCTHIQTLRHPNCIPLYLLLSLTKLLL